MNPKPGRDWPGVGTGAVVILNGALLMIRRDGAHGAGTWSVPGGWVELGEDPIEGAIREVFEETGVTVGFGHPMGWTSVVHEWDGMIHAVTLWVACRWMAGRPRVTVPDKCPEVAWVPFGEIMDRPLFEPLAEWWPQNADHITHPDFLAFR